MKDFFFHFQQRISSAGKDPLLPLESLGVCNSSRSSDSTLGDKYLINEQTLPLTVVDEVTKSIPPEFPCQDSLPLYITSLASTFVFLVLEQWGEVNCEKGIFFDMFVCNNHITYIYIESLSTYFENCLLSQFVSQGSFSWPSSQWPAIAALRDKSNGGKDQCIYMYCAFYIS